MKEIQPIYQNELGVSFFWKTEKTIQKDIIQLVFKETGLQLIETYAYARIYKKGDILHRHKDRFSCEISTTMNLGGDDWPIYIATKESDGTFAKDESYQASKTKGIKVKLHLSL